MSERNFYILMILLFFLFAWAKSAFGGTIHPEYSWGFNTLPIYIDPDLSYNGRILNKCIAQFNKEPLPFKMSLAGASADYTGENYNDAILAAQTLNGVIIAYEPGSNLGINAVGNASIHARDGFGKAYGGVVRINATHPWLEGTTTTSPEAIPNIIMHEVLHIAGLEHSANIQAVNRLPLMNGAPVIGRECMLYDDINALYEKYNVNLRGHKKFTINLPGIVEMRNTKNVSLSVYKNSSGTVTFTNLKPGRYFIFVDNSTKRYRTINL
jgi:hypothetical protein